MLASSRMLATRASLDVRRNGVAAWRNRLHEVHASTMEQLEVSRRAREALVAQVGVSVKAVLEECDPNLHLRRTLQRGDQMISEDVAERLERCGQLICAAEDQLCSPIRRRPRGRSSSEALFSNSASMLSCFEQKPPRALLCAADCRFSMVLLRLCLVAWRSRMVRLCSPPKRPVKARSPSPAGHVTPPPGYPRQQAGILTRSAGFSWAAPEDFASPLGFGTVLIAPGDAPFSPLTCGRQTPSFSGASAIKMMHSPSEEEGE
eukprot:CAMPEP_0169061676 /NCGR_PEP_ID=MMETSP1015-20121227/254_1 /TAXON_ID=342587 /ORGANISM="Karlodinium micrum, Strain CCMP2283" /LENGTH=261 /DNA_ID=CAMNT_0009119713 /DNA_START=11 /DNA_END=793 /DNA_ORIENTATION=+